jgi:hypothetical protein
MRGAGSVARAALGVVAGLLALVLALVPERGAAQAGLEPAALVGVWHGAERTGDLVVLGELILHPGGQYQRAFAVAHLQGFQSGRWELAANWLRFVPTDYEPKVYLGIPQAPPPSETWVVHRFDGRVIEATVGMTAIRYERVR